MTTLDPRTFIGETKQDLINEEQVIRICCEAWGVQYFKMAAHERVDYVLYQDSMRNVVALAEVKCRYDHNFHEYGDIFCPLHKYTHCRIYAAAIGVPALLISKHNDGVFWVDMASDKHYQCRVIKDHRNRGPGDETPCVTWKGDAIKEVKRARRWLA